MKFVSLESKIFIQHAKNLSEKRFGKYKVDGWYAESRTVYEFHGCVYHGCPKCFNPNTYNTLKNELMSETFAKHNERMKNLKELPDISNIIEIWECEFDNLVKNNSKLLKLLNSEKIIKPALSPRDALSGGRVNALQLLYEGKAGYIDFTSLYPYVQKYGSFPLGHPIIITENFKTIDKYFGLVYCSVLPPKDLYIPTLPYHVNGKLLFPLCGTCAKNQLRECSHNDDERELEGTWVILEVIEALNCGYKITYIYEVWHYEKIETYDKMSKEGGLFTNYVNTFLKIKQEASGYPSRITTEADKDAYIKDYFDNEGIVLDKSRISVNPGLKTISKLLLNSQWGRYAMQTRRTQCTFISTLQELYAFFDDNKSIVKDVMFPNDNVGIVYHEDRKDLHWGSNQTNVVIAAFVTAQARLKLYEELKKLGKRVLYFDTDSIIYKKLEGAYEPLLGDYLGQFTNEIDPNEGKEIIEFASAGPKNYSYKLDTGITHSKVKGFSLNFAASKKIDFQKIRSIIKNSTEKISESIVQNTIVRNKKDWSLLTKNLNKVYRMVYDKRIIMDDFSTLPYGFQIFKF